MKCTCTLFQLHFAASAQESKAAELQVHRTDSCCDAPLLLSRCTAVHRFSNYEQYSILPQVCLRRASRSCKHCTQVTSHILRLIGCAVHLLETCQPCLLEKFRATSRACAESSMQALSAQSLLLLRIIPSQASTSSAFWRLSAILKIVSSLQKIFQATDCECFSGITSAQIVINWKV